MRTKIKDYWDYIQSLFDIDGDTIMFFFSVVIMWTIWNHNLNSSGAAAYASAIGCFAYSNKGGGKPS